MTTTAPVDVCMVKTTPRLPNPLRVDFLVGKIETETSAGGLDVKLSPNNLSNDYTMTNTISETGQAIENITSAVDTDVITESDKPMVEVNNSSSMLFSEPNNQEKISLDLVNVFINKADERYERKLRQRPKKQEQFGVALCFDDAEDDWLNHELETFYDTKPETCERGDIILKDVKLQMSCVVVLRRLKSTQTSEREDKLVRSTQYTHTVAGVTVAHKQDTWIMSQSNPFKCHFSRVSNSSSKKNCVQMKCSYCMMKFPNVKSLMSHMQEHLKNQTKNSQKPPEKKKKKKKKTKLIVDVNIVKMEEIFDQEKKKKNEVAPVTGAAVFNELYKCYICCEKFATMHSFLVHFSVDHADVSMFQCCVCCNQSDTIHKFRYHLQKHTENKKFECEYCHKKFRGPQVLENHYVVHTGAKKHKCKECGKYFSQSAALYTHKKIHSGLKPHACSYCDYRSTRLCDLQCHVRTHTGEKPFQCHMCQRWFSKRYHLKQHIHTHSNLKPFRCTVCKRGFNHKSNLRVHLKLHTGLKPFECNICHSKFARNFYLSRHMEVHKENRPVYVCQLCGKSFSRKCYLNIHKTTHEQDPQRFNCDICGHSCARKGNLAEHMKRHVNGKKFPCLQCGKMFLKAWYVKRHMLTHTEEKTKECLICEKKFKLYSTLAVHIETHMTTMKFACEICGRRFRVKSNMTKHMLTHLAVRPYPCSRQNCSESFLSLRDLRRHDVKWHIDRKPYPCHLCHKSFDNTVLRVHHQVRCHGRHAGHLKNQCNVCGKRFLVLKRFRTHLRYHMKERKYFCDTCERGFYGKEIMERHILCVHLRHYPFECDHCKSHFGAKHKMAAHIERWHLTSKPFQCLLCYKQFDTKIFLRDHMVRSHGHAKVSFKK